MISYKLNRVEWKGSEKLSYIANISFLDDYKDEERKTIEKLTSKCPKNEKEFLDELESASKSNLLELLNNLSGSFAIIKEYEDEVFLAVDLMRSLPLYVDKQSLTVSDRISSLMNLPIQEEDIDKVAESELLSSGYAFRNRTLNKNILALTGGEYLTIDKKTGKIQVKSYYDFSYKPSDEDEDVLMEDLRNAYRISAKRIAKRAGGRQIVIPLSAGQDSRLVAYYLNEIGYKNLLCYSYGVTGNWESEKSKKVADFLGLKWIFVPYEDVDWNKWFKSKEYSEFAFFDSGMVAIPHFQDYHAIKYLIDNKYVDDDAIFVPGHSGDFIEGEEVPRVFVEKKLKQDYVVKEAIRRCMGLQKELTLDKSIKREILRDIKDTIKKSSDSDELVANFENFLLKEMQSKFIVNAVRGYEYFGHDWDLLFWNRLVLDAWTRVDIRKRYHRRFHYKITTVDQKDLRAAIGENDLGNYDGGLKNDVKDFVRYHFPDMYRKFIFNHNNKAFKGLYEKDDIGWLKIINKEEFEEISKSATVINGIISDDFLKRIRRG